MEYCENYKNEYEKVSVFSEKGKSVFEFHFQKLAKNYHDYLAAYFVVEGGVLKDEFRFVNAGRFFKS